ncbi:polyamine ABC transporter substrate-binding protein [Aestuariivirga sp.]|uniref:polyamine ABC transporter substrate-binding protein n=1 Tax=Aestuariivirga sp. TaxID=2650926 RepID=UPI0035AE4203
MTLNRRQALVGMGAAAGLAMPYVRRARADAGVVNVYNWADYIGETTIADFTKETGIKVVYDMYASSEEMEAKMLAGSSGYDVVLQSGLGLPRMVKAKVYQKIDKAKLSNWKNLDPDILQILQGFDPGNDYGVPYTWGSVGFTYNIDLVNKNLPGADLESLDTIFNPDNAQKLASCGISILDSPTDIGPMVLKWLGIDPNKAGPDDYKKMADAFSKIRSYITTFDNTNYLTSLPNGEVCAVNSWSGDYGVAKKRAADAGIKLDLEYFIPKTGAPAWFDVWAIPSDAKNVDNAYLFLNYMLRPEVIAAATNFIGYANANKAATPLVDPAITKDPAIYPDAATRERLFTLTPPTPEQEEALTRTWTEIKTGG